MRLRKKISEIAGKVLTLNLFVRILPVLIFFCLALFLLLGSSMSANLDHDEHQFIASAKLFAEKALIPYVDYPYFNMPYLVFIYAFIYKYFGYLLLSARLISVISGFLILLLVFLIGMKNFDNYNYILRSLIAIGFSAILLNNPLFVYASSYSWNHNLAVLFNLLAFVLCCQGAAHVSPKRHLFFTGILIGFSIGIRLHFILTLIPFLIMIFLFPKVDKFKKKIELISFFCLGLILALLPAIFIFMASPEKFIFGNFGYAKLNTLYRQEIGHAEAMTLLGKLIYIKTKIISNPCNSLVVGTFLTFVIASVVKKKLKIREILEIIFIVTLFPFLLIGSLAITPAWYQYFYAPIPFLILGIMYGMKTFLADNKGKKTIFIFFLLLVVISNIYGKFGARNLTHYLRKAFSPVSWEPVKIHQVGQEVGSILREGRVLTLAPIFSLEGKREIYKEFATGPFAWRTGHLLTKDERKKYGVVSEDDLTEFLKKEAPDAILVGFEDKLENAMIDYAKEKGYKEVKLSNGKTLWALP